MQRQRYKGEPMRLMNFLINSSDRGDVMIMKAGGSPVFVTTGAATGITHVYPTTATGQNGAIVMGGQTQNFKKNNPSDTTFYAICDTAGTADVLVSFVDGE